MRWAKTLICFLNIIREHEILTLESSPSLTCPHQCKRTTGAHSQLNLGMDRVACTKRAM